MRLVHKKTGRSWALLAAVLATASTGCSQLGNVIVKPVIDKAIANGKKEQDDFARQAKQNAPKGLDQPIVMPDPNSNSGFGSQNQNGNSGFGQQGQTGSPGFAQNQTGYQSSPN